MEKGNADMLSVKVLGPGCSNCQRLYELTRAAVEQFGLEATLQHIADPAQFRHYKLLVTPGLVINEQLVCAGRLPTVAEITTWLANAAMAAEADQTTPIK